MSLWSRISNAVRGERLNREIEEELQSHIDEAIASGRDPKEAHRAFGSVLHTREASHSIRAAGWLESLLADARFSGGQPAFDLAQDDTSIYYSVPDTLVLSVAKPASSSAIGLVQPTTLLSGAIMTETRLPSAPRSSGRRMLTGHIARSSTPSVRWPWDRR